MAYVGADWPDGDASTFGPAGPYETTSQLAPSGVGSTHSPTPPTVLMPATLIALTTTTATPNINDVANFAAASSATPASVASSEHLTTLHPSGPATGSPWPPAFVESANLAAGGVVPAASSWGGAMAPTTMPSSLLHAANSTGGAMANVGQTPMLIFTTTTTTSAPTTSASMPEHTAACCSNTPHHLSPLAAAAAANNTNSNCNRGPGTPPLTLTSPSLVGGHVHTEAMWQARGSPPLIFVPFELTAALSTSSSINLLASGGPSTQLDSPAAPLPADDVVVCGSHPHLPSAAHGRTSTSISTNSLRSEMNTATTTSQQQRCRNSNGGPSASTPLAQASSSSALGITPFTMQILSNSARLLSPPTLMVWPDNGGSCGELPPSSSSRHIDPLQPTHDATSTSSPNLVQHTFIIPAAATLARAATTPPSSPRPPILGPTQTCVPCTELSAVDARLEQCSICLRRHFHHQHHRRRTRVPSAAITSALGATTTTTSDIIHNSTQSQSLSSSSCSSSIASSADDEDEDELMDGSEDAEEVHARTRAELPLSSLLARRRRETAYLPRSASAPLSTEEVKRLRHRGRRMVRLVCRHCFHIACIQRWLLREKRCPLCRFDLSQGSTTASTCSRLANGLS